MGLSDSANLVAFYEKRRAGRSARPTTGATSSWSDRFDGTGSPNPVYTEAYGQLDLNVSYKVNDSLSLQVEAINLTDETQRMHGRNEHQVLFVTQTGPRYMFGARYKFGSELRGNLALSCRAGEAAGRPAAFPFSCTRSDYGRNDW